MHERDIFIFIFERLFLGFTLSILILNFLALFWKGSLSDFKLKFTTHAIALIRIIGIAYFGYYCVSLAVYLRSEDASLFNERATGPYAWAYWMMLLRPLVFCLLSQLFWIKKIKNSNRNIFLITCLILIAVLASGPNMERLVIIVTTIHRDYLPSSWELSDIDYLIIVAIFMSIIESVILFSGLVFVYWFIRGRSWNLKS